ncbi:hypothetical protein BEN30_16270 [Magnetovibrio blakemorei]|uniref:Sulfatase-modifying factor enzyme-like domain-containing protein n=2 Tax=Magnetovibrio blakemorei TaxID=28181 RepID=A0A1E5Q4R7_9PROT|nr:hypothetical protein BEN30_16270 [Magnetovibrio blakemorei]
MVIIPSGSFQMGSNSSIPDEKPVHRLNINYSFAVGKYEVTQAQWGYLMGDNPSKFIKTPSNPVENITWLDALEYIKRLSAKTGRNYRLLTEVEWEYVARSGSTTKYSCGNAPDCLANIAWNLNNSNKQTHPVGQKDPNSFGVYDMLGNVSEWVEDCYSKNYAYDSHESGYYVMGKDLCPRVHRGGHWGKASNSLSVSKRERFAQDEADYILGFRIAVTLER